MSTRSEMFRLRAFFAIGLVVQTMGCSKGERAAPKTSSMTISSSAVQVRASKLLYISFSSSKSPARIPGGLAGMVRPNTAIGAVKLPADGWDHVILSKLTDTDRQRNLVLEQKDLLISPTTIESGSNVFLITTDLFVNFIDSDSIQDVSAESPVVGDELSLLGLAVPIEKASEADGRPEIEVMSGYVTTIEASGVSDAVYNYTDGHTPKAPVDPSLGAFLFDKMGGWSGIVTKSAKALKVDDDSAVYLGALAGSGIDFHQYPVSSTLTWLESRLPDVFLGTRDSRATVATDLVVERPAISDGQESNPSQEATAETGSERHGGGR